MPIDYSKAKIYCIRSPNTDLIYIGSTCQKLSQRMGEHRGDIKRNTNIASKIIFDYGEPYIELLENYSCNNKEELLKKEGEHIRNNNCCNKYIAGRTDKEWREDNKEKEKERKKQYKKDNSEKIKEQSKQYKLNNSEKHKEYKKEYYETNKEKIKEYQKQYRLNNSEKIKEQRNKINEIKNEILKEFKILKEEN